MKITPEIAKTKAAQRQLRPNSQAGDKPWMKMVGGLRHLHKENLRIDRIIEQEFEKIEPEDWV